MDVKANNQNGHVTLSLSGMLNTYACSQVSKDIDRLLADCGQVESLTCDLSELTYISSSGLRILLGLAKRYTDLKISDVQPEVFQVLEMTGFTKIMHVEKALRRLSIDGYQEIGRGGVGTVYRIDDDTIIKVFRQGTTLSEVRTEITMAKEAFVLGMPTAISFDIVRTGTQYGLVYELLRANTLSACIRQEPERIDEFANLYAALFHQLHAIKVPSTSNIPNAIAREEMAIRHISRYFDTESIDLLLRLIDYIPQDNRLLHCDLQTKNAMVQDGELMLIDMGEVGYGHPVLDLGHAYSSMVSLIGDYEQIIGLPQKLCHNVFHRMIGYYFSGMSEAEVAHRTAQIEAIACIRNFSWLSISDSFPDSVIRQCQESFSERVAQRKDYLVGICETLSDWRLD